MVEDEPLLAALLAQTLEGANFEVATAGDAGQAREQVDSFDPDIALLDISLGNGPTGVHLAHVLAASRPDIALLFLTRFPDAESANAEGLPVPPNVGFLRKHMISDTAYLLDAIEKVLAERASEVRQDEVRGSGIDGLGDQPLRVLRLLAEGYSNNEIARRLDTSVKSVERWLDIIYRELELPRGGDVNLRVEAARRYYLRIGVPTVGNR